MFLCGRNYSRTLGAAGGLAVFTSLLLSGSTLAVGASNPSSKAEILWDQFGIPHIYGPDLLTVVRGLGYAEMENHAETILINVASARGRSAEYFGLGANNANYNNDVMVRTEDIPNRAQTWLQTGGVEQAAIIQAFVDGANEYANRPGITIDPSLRQVLPLVPTDVTAGIQNVVHFHFMLEQDNIQALVSAWQTGGISAANAVACSYTPGCPTSTVVASNTTPGGSNGWAIAPKKARPAMPSSWAIRIRLGATIVPSHPSKVLVSISGWRPILSSAILRSLTSTPAALFSRALPS